MQTIRCDERLYMPECIRSSSYVPSDKLTNKKMRSKQTIYFPKIKSNNFLFLFTIFLTYSIFTRTLILCQQPKPEDITPEPPIVSEPPTDVKLAECSGRSATITWQEPLTTQVMKYVILGHRLGTAKEDLEKLGEVPFPGNSYRTDLRPGSNYTFKVATVNNDEFFSAPSNDTEVCNTPADVPDHHPLNVVGKGTETNNMKISWEAMKPEEHNGPGFYYQVEYKPSDQPQWHSEDITNASATSYTVKDLEPYTPFDIRVKAMNSLGAGRGPALIVSGYSGEDIPTAKPTNLRLEQVIDGKRATIAWDPVPLDQMKGPLVGYKVRIYNDIDGVENVTEIKVPMNIPRATIDKLRPTSENRVTIAALNNKYDGPESDELLITTPESVPGKPKDLQGIPLGINTARVVWKAPKNPNGKILGYRIMQFPIDESGNPLAAEREAEAIRDPNQNEAFMINLTPATRYNVSVRAATAAGYGDASSVTMKTTREGVPDKPDFEVKVVDGSFNVSQKFTANPGAFFYVIYKKEGGDWVATTMVPALQWKLIKNVSEDTNYEIKVIAVNENDSATSDSQVVMLPLERAPNRPTDVVLERCDPKETRISWDIKPVEHSPTTHFVIEHEDNRNGEWKVLEDKVPADKDEFTITDLAEGIHRFRVISGNRKGSSGPSESTEECEIVKPAHDEADGDGDADHEHGKDGADGVKDPQKSKGTKLALTCWSAIVSIITAYVLLSHGAC